MADQSHVTYLEVRLNDHTLDDNLPLVPSPSPSRDFSRPRRPLPTASLGVLDTLPIELLRDILVQLDYRAIALHASNAPRGILAIQTGRWITCERLFDKLCTAECERCGDFGGYLYIIICSRVCFLCLSHGKRFLPLRPSHARRKFGLDKAMVATLPRMRVKPGIYSPNEKKAPSATLVDYRCALRAGVARHGSLAAMRAFVADAQAGELQAYSRRAEEAGHTSRVRKPQAADPHDGHSGNPFRFVAIVRVPWLDRTASQGEVEWGFHCLGCAKSNRLPLHFRRKFSAVSFAEHLTQYGEVKDGKHCKPGLETEAGDAGVDADIDSDSDTATTL
ncbi:hypothetical protein S40288_05533 [Stachybotrys chartarum IBT 40288]|nr:hypothetical protein S40288_05533 [Stachybotrys chartarum IBT 40288]